MSRMYEESVHDPTKWAVALRLLRNIGSDEAGDVINADGWGQLKKTRE